MSVDSIRRSVRDSLKEILTQRSVTRPRRVRRRRLIQSRPKFKNTKCNYRPCRRLKESDLKVSVEKASEVAKKTERELFHMYKDTDNKYKNKYRSLMFNLKDTKNNVSVKPEPIRTSQSLACCINSTICDIPFFAIV